MPATVFPAQEMLGVLEKVVGGVKLRRMGETGYQTACIKDIVYAGDRIRTSPQGKALIRLADGSTLELAEATLLTITHLRLEGLFRDSEVELIEGTLRTVATTMKGEFDLRVGSSIASIRGTDFVASIRKRASFYFQNKGNITVNSASSSVTLKKDMMTVNYNGRNPLPPVSITENLDLAAIRDVMCELTTTEIPPSLQKRVNLREILARWNINYASYLIDKGLFYDAETVLLIAQELTENQGVKSETLMQIANIYARYLNKPQSAFLYYNKILSQFPASSHYEVALFNIALVLNEMGETEKAKEHFIRYIKEFPEGIYREVSEMYLNR